MEKVLETTFVDVFFSLESSQMDNRWKSETDIMEAEDFKEVVLKMTNKVVTYAPKYILADTRNYRFTLTPDLQIWSGDNYFEPALKAGLKKLAFIVSPSIFAQVSIEQMMEEEKALGVPTKYFETEEDAVAWFNNFA